MKNIIVLEDNKNINELISNILVREGYKVFSCYNAFDAYKEFENNKIDCILTDLMLPIITGEVFIQEIRKKSNVHIIVISAKTSSSDKLDVLKIGADDYLFKPFLEEEVRLKLRNFFYKKDYSAMTKSFNEGDVIFVEGKPELIIKNTTISLTSVEYQIIRYLIQAENKVISREQFLDVLYSFGDEVFDRVIDVHIRNIRRKIKTKYDKDVIKTIYGLGYCWGGILDE